jgi:hypothetical protein
MFPVSYGPFKDEDSAREWIRLSGIVRSTRLLYSPAAENIKVVPGHRLDEKADNRAGFLRSRMMHDLVP